MRTLIVICLQLSRLLPLKVCKSVIVVTAHKKKTVKMSELKENTKYISLSTKFYIYKKKENKILIGHKEQLEISCKIYVAQKQKKLFLTFT